MEKQCENCKSFEEVEETDYPCNQCLLQSEWEPRWEGENE